MRQKETPFLAARLREAILGLTIDEMLAVVKVERALEAVKERLTEAMAKDAEDNRRQEKKQIRGWSRYSEEVIDDEEPGREMASCTCCTHAV